MQTLYPFLFLALCNTVTHSMQQVSKKIKKVSFAATYYSYTDNDYWTMDTFKFNRNLKSSKIVRLWQENKYKTIHQAVFHGKIKILEQLLARNLNPNSQNVHGNTAAHIAFFSQTDEKLIKSILNLLKDNDADFNIPNVWGYTPLHLAILNEKPLVGCKLIELGADPNLKDSNNETPTMLATRIISLLPEWKHNIKNHFNLFLRYCKTKISVI